MTLNDYNPLIVHCFYITLGALAILLNSLLIYLIRCRSPLIIRPLKLLLMYTASIQILIAIMAVTIQGRLLGGTTVTAFLPIGPCRLFGRSTCFATYNIFTALSLYVEVLIIHTMYYRYRMMQPAALANGKLQISLIIAAVLPTIVLILPYTRSLDFDNAMNVTIHEHPGQRLEEYGEFGGFTAATVQMRAYALISFTIVAASPIIILYFKHLILRELHNLIDERSERIKSISKVFVKALTAQAMVPLCCYLPIGLLFNMSKAYQWDLVIVEYLLAGIAALPCVIDPLFAIYFITPYREWVLKKFSRLSLPELRFKCLQRITAINAVSAAVQK